MDVGGLKPILPILADRCWDGGQADGKGQYWSRLKQVCVFQEQGNVTSLDFLPHSPYHLASTSRNRLTIFDTSAQESMCFHSRFKSPLYAASFRQDGSLIGVATHGGHVHFFDATMRKKNKQRLRLENPIRSYHAHRCRVNSLAYSPSKLHFITSGDDGRVKLWDLGESTSERPLWKCHGHQDQVRECKFAEANENIIVTGSYDHTVMMWDMRSKPNSPLLTLQHDDPVEKLLLTSKDRIVITASKRLITFWDLTAGGKILHRLENHHKTVTSLCVASSGKVLLSGGLDRRINGFRLETGQYELVYSLKTASPVLALAVSGDDQFMAYGMSSLLALYQRNSSEDAKSISLNKEEGEEFNENDATTERSEGNPVAYSFEHTTRQRRELPLFSTATQPRRLSAPATIQSERSMTQTGVPQSRVVELTARQLDMVPLGRLDNMLRQKTYKELVRTVVRNTELVEKHPEIGVSAFNQLIIRQKLYTALAGHGGEDLARIIHFLRLHLFKAPFFDVLHQVANVLITVYAEEEVSSEAVDEISHFKQDIESEVQLRKSIGKSLGAMGTILAASIDISRQTSLPASKKERKRDDESTTIPRNNGVEEGHHLTNGC